jgi:cytochrome P450
MIQINSLALPGLPAPPRFKPAAPPALEDAPSFLRLMFDGAFKNPLAGIPKSAFEQRYRRVRALHLVYHGVNDPDAIKRVFLDNAANYVRPGIVRRILAPAIGDGLFNAEGDSWREQRRMMAPVFSPAAVAAFTPIFAQVAQTSADRWEDRDGEVVDMAAESTRATLSVIDQALFSGETGMSFEETADHVRAFLTGATEIRLGLLLGLEALDGGPAQRRARLARRVLVEKMSAFIHRRADDPEPPEDFVTRLYKAFLKEHPRGQAIRLTLDNAMTFFVAGHETTANALTWALYLLSRDSQAQAWAHEEAAEAWAAGGSPEEILARLPYLRMVWEETLRLYPPVARIDRQAVADDVLCGQVIRKGDMVTIWPWVLHRHRSLWKDADLFNPENFDPEAKAAHHRYQYIPFGAGPRICIGMPFAQAEGLLILSHWLSRFRFSPTPGHEAEPWADITVHPTGGMPLIVEKIAS